MIDQQSEHRSKSPNYVSTIQQPKPQEELNSSTLHAWQPAIGFQQDTFVRVFT